LLNKDEIKKHFNFLDGLRESGVTNMLGSSTYLVDTFGLNKNLANHILAEWIKTFNPGTSLEARVSQVDMSKYT